MDEEENFARLLSASTPAPRPTLYTDSGTDDPWANPFGGEHDAWGASTGHPSFARAPTPPPEPEPEVEEPPRRAAYDERPDPPSVIAAREREELASHASAHAVSSPGFEDPYATGTGGWSPQRTARSPKSPRAARSPTSPRSPSSPKSTMSPSAHRPAIPAGLIDEDLITERDARTSLTRAFVKSDTPATPAAVASPEKHTKYVFRPKVAEHHPEAKAPAAAAASPQSPPKPAAKPATDTPPAAIPLPESTAQTPTASRPHTPQPALSVPASVDRVSVSPLETPGAEEGDFGFRSLAIGAAGNGAVQDAPRFGGRGWGAIDAEPLSSGGDPWNPEGAVGWSGEAEATPTRTESPPPEKEEEEEDDDDDTPLSAAAAGSSRATGSPRRSKLLSTPVFQITVSDPTKVGDQNPMRGHVVYTVRTRTTSPHYRRGEFSVLRRFSDFLWLFEQLSHNNPGVIVPPVPDKQPFGRFQDQFIETRRVALERCLGKITAHPILQLDPDLRLFLESDSFALDVKNRRQAPMDGTATPSSGFMSSWTGPRYIEQDEWFDQKKTYLDHLEGQLKGVSKALDVASKARLEMAVNVGEFADAAQVLADSDLGAAMCAALARLADLSRRERIAGEDQAKADVAQLLNLADEYVRFIASVRLAFAARVRAFHTAQAAEKEVIRVRKQREKDRQAGRLGDRAASSMAEVQEAERRARDASADFEAQTKLVKSEFARFERERVDEFRRTLTAHLDDQIGRQQALVTAWEEYHAMLLKMVQRAQQQHQAQQQGSG